MTQHPHQKLCCIEQGNQRHPLLFAASGSRICSFDLQSGAFSDQWPHEGDTDSDSEPDPGSENGRPAERPNKRRKVDAPATDELSLSPHESEESIEIVAERKKGERRKPKIVDSKLPNISHLVATSDGESLIAVTTEDKSITVFRVKPGGRLSMRSKRVMPKRLCAIVLTPDEETILAGDKFGDVYSLPLHPSRDYTRRPSGARQSKEPFVPSATELTVHTKGNLEALRQQRELKRANSRKEGPDFEHKLLLGHVSVLTDVVVTELHAGPKRKQYILTADRDEHVRVSRGVAQAYIIERYCLGHRDFVSRLSILPWASGMLVVGSGEPSLKVYDWLDGRLLDEELFHGTIQEDIGPILERNKEERGLNRLSVAGIWPIYHRSAPDSPPARLLLVSLEGLPFILSYIVTDQGQLHHHQTVTLRGNVLDVVVHPARWMIIVSIDTIHQPGSMKVSRTKEAPAANRFETFGLFTNSSVGTNGSAHDRESSAVPEIRWQTSSVAVLLNNACVDKGDTVDLSQWDRGAKSQARSAYSPLGELFYGLENLRKKRSENTEAYDADDVEGPD